MSNELCLNKLPRSPFIRSLKFKRTTPGNFTRLLAPVTASINDKVVDPSHPLAKRHPSLFANKLPIFRDPALTVRVFPKALLEVTSWPRPDPPFSMAPERRETKGGQLNMSLMHVITRKVHKSSVIRSKIKNRLKNAVSLIATHGSRVETKDGRKLIVSDMSVAGSKIVLTDWTYLFIPQLEIYRMPDTDLIDLVRQALEKVHSDASTLNETWSNMGRMAKNNVIRSPVERRPPVQKDRFHTTRPQSRPEEQRTSAKHRSSEPSTSKLLFRNRPLLRIESSRRDEDQ